MKEKKLFWGKLLVSWEKQKDEHLPWHFTAHVWFFHTWDLVLFGRRIVLEWG
jgi:hypothetical protein